ncbi:MAG: hypothetical protein WHS44_12105 [Fimbriimonadales bacterium]|nr:MAG: hypothetical protein KatS3mg018_2164 [Fimbriimonadales bacterium]
MRRWVFGLGMWGALLSGVWGQAAVAIVAKPLLGTTPAANGAFPIAVQLESRQGNHQGVLSVSVGGMGNRREYLYPIDLPAGSRKVVVATPIVSRYGDTATIRFTARGANAQTRLSINRVLEVDQLAVVVGDAIGGLQVLKQVRSIRNPFQVDFHTNRPLRGVYEVAYCAPELFPDQAIALSGAQMIVLTSGAERLRTEQWAALRQWVMLGGTLIVSGGAGAVYLQSPALRDLLPVAPQGTREVAQLTALGQWLGVRPPAGRATITQAQRIGGDALLQQDGLPLIAARPYGLGAVVFLAFNPLERPLSDYDARARFWQTLVDAATGYAPSFSIAALHMGQSGVSRDPWSGQATTTITADIDPPSVVLIIVLLSAYFMLVAPINYWTLKRLRALDWAWLTTPLIALVFVGVLWRLAGDLYRKSLSSKVQTVLIAQAGSSDAYAVNSALFFFPRAGVFDLQFDQSDMVEVGVSDDMGANFGQTTIVRTIEGDPKRVDGYRVSNLSFQWFRYTRTVQLQGQVEGSLRLQQRNGQWVLSGALRNRLPYELREAQIMTPHGVADLGAIEPRGARTLRSESLIPLPPFNYSFTSGWDSVAALSGEQLAQLLFTQRPELRRAVLIARASEPVLPPELREATERSAEVVYMVSLPLEGDAP